MTLPQSMEEFNARVRANTRIEGYGATTRTILPCPFCAAADWLAFPVTAGLSRYADVQKPSTCKECRRTVRFAIARLGDRVWMSLIQTGGDDPPVWLVPRPVRET